jgi:transcriptional regulator GlxA family with amidase domain
MHDQPAAAWTLERLAHEVGLSGSVFADRFAHFVQDTPMQYSTRWRMQLATHLLERQGVGLAQVVAEVG